MVTRLALIAGRIGAGPTIQAAWPVVQHEFAGISSHSSGLLMGSLIMNVVPAPAWFQTPIVPWCLCTTIA